MIDIENPSRANFAELHATGYMNPAFTFADYLELCQERRAERAEAERNGWLDGAEEPPDIEDPESLHYLAMIVTQQAAEPARDKQAA